LGWTLFDQQREKLSDFQRKRSLFWISGRLIARRVSKKFRTLNDLKNKYGADLHIVGLHVGGEEDQPAIPKFVEKLKINYTLAYPDDELSRILMGADSAIPQTFIFDRNGRLTKKIIGFDNIIKAELDEAIEQAINER
jgi:hypothetical protein